MSEIINFFISTSGLIGYGGIILLMTVESSFIPFPSEIVVPPAAYLAQQGEMNLVLVILSGIFGSLIGASLNYLIAFTLGRKIIYSLAKSRIAGLFLINEKKISLAENYFRKYGNISTFFGRLIPAVRQLISLPAGFSRMNFGNFLFFTFLGSGLWTIILAILGYTLGANKELLAEYYGEISAGLVFAVFTIIVLYLLRKYLKRTPENSETEKGQDMDINP